ncbi:MAG: HAMP domain-containing protein [Cytophagaceae bacterium]|nr:HAMP domain-containing protein [Gemmatimonadaceae bacterium]
MSAREALAVMGPDTGLLVSTGIRRLDGTPLLAMNRRLPPAPVTPPALVDSGRVGQMFNSGGTAMYETLAPVRRDGRTVAHVVSVRSLTASPTTLKTVESLAGASGVLWVGNADGTEWTDLQSALGPRPIHVGDTEITEGGVRRLVSAAPIPGTPLLIASTVAANQAGASLKGFLWTLVLIAIAIVAAGATAGWIVIRQVTNPLVDLTAAAEAIAAGHRANLPARASRNDEIGRLSDAFGTMSGRVTDAREHLERQVRERTAELERTQRELIQREKLAVLGQLASSVGHELRNPLGVMSNISYYLSTALTDVPPKAREHLAMLRRQVGLAERIVTDILDFTRVKQPETATVPVEAFVDAQLQRVTLPETVRVERSVAPGVPDMSADPFQVGQVLYNVLTNAAQSMEPRGGVLGVRAHGTNGSVFIDVTDEGPGVPEEHHEQIFEPLYTTKLRGIGLGLSVSRTLAQANGGTLRVAQSSARGTTFRLEVPSARAN